MGIYRKYSGFILILVLGMIALMTMLAVSFYQSSRTQRILSRNYLDKSRAKLLALSGLEYSRIRLNLDIFATDKSSSFFHYYSGTYQEAGDRVKVRVYDLNASINVNDGIRVGKLEESYFPMPLKYKADALDPEGFNGRSGKTNLRLRRLLNAYGDVFRYLHVVFNDRRDYQVFLDEYNNGAAIPPLTSNASSKLQDSLPPSDSEDPAWSALGDRLIENRPDGGYRSLEEIKKIINDWGRKNVDAGFLSDVSLRGKDFFDLVSADLSVRSFEDESFFRIGPIARFGSYEFSDQGLHGDFYPRDLSIEGMDLSQLFLKHSVPLINVNESSFFVRAALFYSLVKVNYSCEGGSTVNPYFTLQDYFNPELLNNNTAALESAMILPSIGISGPVFPENRKTFENGRKGGNEFHFMSLRDALFLAAAYGKYLDTQVIDSFDRFKVFLETHSSDGGGVIQGNTAPFYERARSGDYDKFASTYELAPWSSRGEFTDTYVAATLPHVLSCIRRLPGYLGAPQALMSPYLILATDTERDDYKKDGKICRQAFYKVEDFVIRYTLPKICFSPCGFYRLESRGQVIRKNRVSSEVVMREELRLFETKYYRTQKDFDQLTDPQTSDDILLGPAFPGQSPSDNLGFAGLKDYEDDLSKDPFMSHFGGYKPQIVMNFNPEDSEYGLENSSSEPTAPPPQDPATDAWKEALNGAAKGLDNSQARGADFYLFPESSSTQTNLSPFGGFYFSSMKQGEFSTNIFDASLYWRLDPWLTDGHPVGQDVSAGLATFWFRMPSDYYRLHASFTEVDSFSKFFYPVASSRVFFSLNLWESFFASKNDNLMPFTLVKRPLTITVGLKKYNSPSADNKNIIFIRYDSGGGASSRKDSQSYNTFIAPNNYQIYKSTWMPYVDDQYDFMGFHLKSSKKNSEGEIYGFENNSYEYYRALAHRCVEARVVLNNNSSLPGIWHRVSAGWNFRRRKSPELESRHQIWIRLHDETAAVPNPINDYFQSVYYNPKPDEIENYYYPPGDQKPYSLGTGGYQGLMMTYDSSMVLSLGESQVHRTRSYVFEGRYLGMFFYRPFWRLNSCLDNFRLYMGPSKNENLNGTPIISKDYLDVDSPLYDKEAVEMPKYNFYGALRYKVMNASEDYGSVHPETNEPIWILNMKLPENSQLMACGTRVYYPSSSNTPYVRLKAHRVLGEEIPPEMLSENEQNFYFKAIPVTDDFRLSLQYMAHKPKLDGDLNTPSLPLQDQEIIQYRGYLLREGLRGVVGDHCTTIPWIKEVSIRYKSPKSLRVYHFSSQ
jgi:hypothetical protein